MYREIEGIRLHNALADSADFAGFWSEENCRLLAQANEMFSPRLQVLLDARRAFKAAIDVGDETLHFPLDDGVRSAEWKVKAVDPLYTQQGPELVSPLRDQHMAINAAKAHGQQWKNGLVSTIFDNCDAGHYSNTLQGVRDLSHLWSGFYSVQYGDSEYRYDEKHNGMGVWWFRVNGLGAAPLSVKEMAMANGAPISRTLFEMVFFASQALDKMKRALSEGDQKKATLLAPKIYVPKLEFSSEAQWINQVCEFVEEQKGVVRGSIKIGLVVETPTIIYQLDEACYALRDRFVKASFGRYDALAAAIAINSENPHKVPPGPGSMGLKTAPACDQFAHMLRVLHRRGVYAIGGMDVPVGQTEAVFSAVRASKTWEGLFVDSAWISAPAHTLAAAQGLEAGRKKREMEAADSALNKILNEVVSETEMSEKLNAIPQGIVTEAELNGLILKFIEFAEGYLRGIGCCAFQDFNQSIAWPTMEDFATAGEYPIKVIYTWLKHRQTIQFNNNQVQVLSQPVLEEKVATILASIKERYDRAEVPAKGVKMSVSTYSEGYYPQAALLFLASTTRPQCVRFVKDDVCWPACQYLNSLKMPQQNRSFEDNKSWAARVLSDPKARVQYPWYCVDTKQQSPRLDDINPIVSSDILPKENPLAGVQSGLSGGNGKV